ncbi:hypothetical protein B296_00045197 [Ensete ventricosum]|uniref:Uncharacterized protein n=1 Tax=Ensete ventricosum TaxID=4639 RepID=A0A426WVC3_ENSVE|nr:hypothetical protein B296_00045197 [Ensete ventricosum]
MLYLSLVLSLVVLSGLIIPLILVRSGHKLLKLKHYLSSQRPIRANVGSAQYRFREIYLMPPTREILFGGETMRGSESSLVITYKGLVSQWFGLE